MRESERLGLMIMNNYDFLRQEINDWKDDFLQKGFIELKRDGIIFTDKWRLHNKKIEADRKKLNKKKDKKFVFITLQDFTRRLCDLEKLQRFIKRISYMYDDGFWVIETGKNKDEADFNVHIHMLVKIRNSVKNHKHVMNIKWTNLFNTDLYHEDYYQCKQHRDCDDMPEYMDWVEEKLNYFKQEMKGTHKNTVDLGLSGRFEG